MDDQTKFRIGTKKTYIHLVKYSFKDYGMNLLDFDTCQAGIAIHRGYYTLYISLWTWR